MFDCRGIDVVRNRIKLFAHQKVTLPPGRHKIVILDEADRCVYVSCACWSVCMRACVCVCVCVCVRACVHACVCEIGRERVSCFISAV